jgi:glucose/arabinose dehydrogenase
MSGRYPQSIPLIAAILCSALAEEARAQNPRIPRGDLTIELTPIAAGLTAPVYATHAADGSGRLFVVDQIGQIRIIDQGGNLLATPFLDLSTPPGRMVQVNPGFDERGLLGLAFHPRYRNNGRFFVRYSKPRPGSMGEPCFGTSRGCHEEILSEFRVSATDPNRGDPASERFLFRVDKPQFNHNSGQVMFGPAAPRPPGGPGSAKSLLYFSFGDGGGAHDGLADMPPSHGPIGNGQNIDAALGKMHRIDVDSPPDPGLPYTIPPDNPFVGRPGRDEIYAYGFRNPYRWSFDDGRGGDHRLYVGDVGQALHEEIDIVVKGGNYGWVLNEGFLCFNPFSPNYPPPFTCSGDGASGEPLLLPLAAYNHADGIAVIGGFVYRGPRFPELWGKYVFGDFSRAFNPGSGRLFWLDPAAVPTQIFEFKTAPGTPDLVLHYLLGIGRDEDGELYAMTSLNLGPTGSTGEVFRIVRP